MSKKGQIMFMGPYTGGVGVSTLAVNTALALSAKHKVVLLDLNAQNPHGHLLLSNLATEHAQKKNIYTLQQAMDQGNDVSKEVLEDHLFVVHEFGSGILHFLAGPVTNPENAQKVTSELTQALYRRLMPHYDYIVIDGGRTIESKMVYYLIGLPELFLVTGQDYVQATDVKRVMLYLNEGMSLPEHRMHLIINGYDPSRSPKQNQIEAIAGMQAVTTIPYDMEVRKGPETGQPIVAMKAEKAKRLRHAYLQLAEMIVQIGRESTQAPAIELEPAR